MTEAEQSSRIAPDAPKSVAVSSKPEGPDEKTSPIDPSRLHNQAHSVPVAPAEPGISPPTPTVPEHNPPLAHEPTIGGSRPMPERSSSMPPSPQPGSLPAPAVNRSRSTSPRRDIPPPPKVGEKMKPASYYSPAPTPTHNNQQTPFQGFGGQTPATATFAGYSGLLSPHPNALLSPARNFGSPAQTPTAATMPPANLEHPPGYVQNPYAADMTPEQRFASQHGATSPSLGYNDNNHGQGFGGFKSPTGMFGNMGTTASPAPRGAGILNGDGKGDESVWGMMGGWAKTVGKKMSEVEGEVWRRINGE